MQRRGFEHDGLTLSYLDSGGDQPLIIALHALWMEARTFEAFANSMPDWRVVSLDQRGHGLSDHASDYSRDAFVGDIAALLDHLGARDPAVLIGNSLGGTNAFVFAARHPERVRALVVEEGPAEQHESFAFIRDWHGVYPTNEALERKIGERLAWSVKPSFRETAYGWILAFEPEELVSMAARRQNTGLVTLKAGHVVHHDDLAGFVARVQDFLGWLPPTGREPGCVAARTAHRADNP